MLEKVRKILDRLELTVTYEAPKYLAVSTGYRGGDTPTGVQCYELNVYDCVLGRAYTWIQFVSEVKKISAKDAEAWLSGVEIENGEDEDERIDKIQMGRTLAEEDYNDLVKSYQFFLNRGIDASVLEYFDAGLAQSGPMYGRVVFKIRNDKGKLIGVVGRDALNRTAKNPNLAKWKNKGPKAEWVYPRLERTGEAIAATGQIIVVESLGDTLALCDAGIWQVVCNFGLYISPARTAYILKKNPKEIFIALNNDLDKKTDWGQQASEKMKNKLNAFFSEDKLIISPPDKGDFGEMSRKEIQDWAERMGVKHG